MKQFPKGYLEYNWEFGRPIIFKGKKYKIGLTKNGKYFLKPITNKEGKILWLKPSDNKKILFKVI